MSTKTGKLSSLSSSSTVPTGEKPEPKPKIDPSFKSKRYRDKLRTEVKALEALLPVDRTSLSRKLDSQTVFRLVIALLRTKGYFQAVGQTSEQTEPHSTARHAYDIKAHDVDDSDVTQLVQGLGCLQVLDGFLLVLTADGTILYVSDNVLQYLGYNQVDLMHRCLYSVVHHDDMADLKMVLETSLGHLVSHYEHQGTQDSNHHVEECNLGTSEVCKPLSFICRMRCFSGSSVGYLKMHCSGKIVHLSGLPKSKRSSSNVVLLFCNPFVLRAAEFTTDLQKNVFWTKHDLDLNIKEVDKKGVDIIGFHTEELEKRSFYSLIHPEDLTALATCHKMLVESNEVQTVHFRLQTKGGDWVWLTSRCKVISKNSKKFSIAFSHCPLREEDSTYIQQEAILRRRYAISDLMCLTQFRQSVPPSLSHTLNKEDKLPVSKSKKLDHHRYHPYGMAGSSSGGSAKGGKSDPKKEEAGLLDTSCILEVSCPSAWHAMGDRHSPVLPSSHVAHKISQREKQLQFQEFCRRQQLEGGSHGNQAKFGSSWDGGQPYSVSPSDNSVTSCVSGQDMMPPTSSGHPMVGVAGPNSAYFYPNDSHIGNFGPCVDYGFSPVQASSAATYIHHWYSNPGDMMVNQTSATCLTPSRSPHQCGIVLPMQGPVSSQCPFQAAAPAPPCGGVHVTQSVSMTYPSMPPSPPPSPPTLCHRPIPPYQHSQDAAGENSHMGPQQHLYRPDWFSSRRQTYFAYPSQQPPPYPGRNIGVVSGASTSTSTTTSTITDLEKTTEKFLPVKTETDCEKDNSLRSSQQDRPIPASYSDTSCSRSDRWGRQAWTSNSHTDSMGKSSTVPQSHFGHVNANSFVSLENSMPKASHLQAVYLPQRFPEAQMIQTHSFLHASGSPAAAQYMPYPYPPPHTNLGTPPAYPYGVYPQMSQHNGQYPVNGFYSNQGASMKAATDFSLPIPERPVDLPSIGSFLEYLNEV